MILGRPEALWALLALGVITVIYLLQRERRTLLTGAMFLFAEAPPPSHGGRRLRWWRQHPLFWLQMLAASLLALLLSEPRLPDANKRPQVLVILDDSASMAAFREEALESLRSELMSLEQRVGVGRWRVDFVSSEVSLQGEELEPLLRQVEANWKPSGPATEPEALRRLAASLTREEWSILYLTDHASRESILRKRDYLHWSIGDRRENVGLAGGRVSADGQRWQALLRSYSTDGTERRWRSWEVAPDGSRREIANGRIAIEPNGRAWLEGEFPATATHILVELEGDAFRLDDALPLVRPTRPQVTMGASAELSGFLDLPRLAEAIPDAMIALPGEADLRFVEGWSPSAFGASVSSGASVGFFPGQSAVIFLEPVNSQATALPQPVVASSHPLVEGLPFTGLQAAVPAQQVSLPGEVLVWAGSRPVISWQATPIPRLWVAFAASQSNLTGLPEFVLLMTRVTELVRSSQVKFSRSNLPAGSRLNLPAEGWEGTFLSVSAEVAETDWTNTASLPMSPGFLTWRRDGEVMQEIAGAYALPEEADLREASSQPIPDEWGRELALAYSREAGLTRVGIILLLGILLCIWALAGKEASR